MGQSQRLTRGKVLVGSLQSDELRSRDVTITTAQLLANFATLVEILPAPGASRALIFMGAALYLVYNSIAHTVPGTSDFAIKYTNASEPPQQRPVVCADDPARRRVLACADESLSRDPHQERRGKFWNGVRA